MPCNRPLAMERSMPLTEAAWTRTRTWPGPASGVGRSATVGCSSNAGKTKAFIGSPVLTRGTSELTGPVAHRAQSGEISPVTTRLSQMESILHLYDMLARMDDDAQAKVPTSDRSLRADAERNRER